MGAVEVRCAVVHRVDYDKSPPGRASGRDDRGEGVNQQLGAEPLAVQIATQGELGEEDRGDALRRSAANHRWRGIPLDQIRGDREVAGDGISSFFDEQICTSTLPGRVAGVLL